MQTIFLKGTHCFTGLGATYRTKFCWPLERERGGRASGHNKNGHDNNMHAHGGMQNGARNNKNGACNNKNGAKTGHATTKTGHAQQQQQQQRGTNTPARPEQLLISDAVLCFPPFLIPSRRKSAHRAGSSDRTVCPGNGSRIYAADPPPIAAGRSRPANPPVPAAVSRPVPSDGRGRAGRAASTAHR